jgi:site-specific recombinase XerD
MMITERARAVQIARRWLKYDPIFTGTERLSMAGVEGKTPHCARHAMGKHIIEKTSNIAAVQRQLGHRNATYSMQYARITAEELRSAINDR